MQKSAYPDNNEIYLPIGGELYKKVFEMVFKAIQKENVNRAVDIIKTFICVNTNVNNTKKNNYINSEMYDVQKFIKNTILETKENNKKLIMIVEKKSVEDYLLKEIK